MKIFEKLQTFIDGFKKFIARGNVLDLAVGVIIGSAFSAIVNSLVNDIIMPIIGLALAGIDISSLSLTLKTPLNGKQPPAVLYYGRFIQNVINFLTIALVVFIFVRAAGRASQKLGGFMHAGAKREPEPAPAQEASGPKNSEEARLLREIRDLLKESQAAGKRPPS